MQLSDIDILSRCVDENMIEPYVQEAVREIPGARKDGPTRVISYGPSSYGYDVRIADEFKVFTNVHSAKVDPKDFDDSNFVDIKSEEPVLIPPNSFALGRSYEWIKVPRDILVICIGKSTYARCGIVVNVTPLEPEWEGRITIEISNTTPNPELVGSVCILTSISCSPHAALCRNQLLPASCSCMFSRKHR